MYRSLLTLLAMMLVLPSWLVRAESMQTFYEEVHQPFVTLLSDFTLYSSSETQPSEAIGALGSIQSVRLALNEEQNTLLEIYSKTKVAVETWLGTAWINLQEGNYKFGRLTQLEQTLSLLQEQTELYATPGNFPTSYSLAPQRVQAIASIPICPVPYASPSCYVNDLNDRWYLIHTSWLGDQWIRPSHYVEKYVGIPVEGMIVVDNSMELYLHPFDKPLDEPRMGPQVVKPIAKYTLMNRVPSVWYQVETSQGLRWIHQDRAYGLGMEQVESVKQSVVMATPFHYYKHPFTRYTEDTEQLPQTLQAIGKQNNWYFVLIDGAGKWVNPSLEAALRMTGEWENDAQLGVEQGLVEIALTESSVVLSKPYSDGSYEMNLSPQTVTASRTWASPNGETWYYIHTWQGPKWVLQ